MRERPILFSDAMVLAILAGTKTMTRRVLTPQPFDDGEAISVGRYHPIVVRRGIEEPGDERFGAHTAEQSWPCPYGEPGDRLWVRETHYRYGHWKPVIGKTTKGGRQKWAFVADSGEVRFDRPMGARGGRRHSDPSAPAWHVRLARFMPRWASRLTLEVTSVRVERVQSISEDDARAEGVDRDDEPCDHPRRTCAEIGCLGPGYRAAFGELWQSINGKRPGCAWRDDPWCWCITFKRAA